VFLIAASYLFTRSCPFLERWLLEVRWVRPYLRYLDARTPMPAKARWAALGMMWSAVAASLVLTALSRGLHPAFATLLVASGVVATVVILRYRRPPRAAASRVTS
jgi:uncharacterized membrane protein YbaN (DUF454 family)